MSIQVFRKNFTFQKKKFLLKYSSMFSGTINLIWLSCPISILSSLLLGFFWKFGLEMPENQDEADQYRLAPKVEKIHIK